MGISTSLTGGFGLYVHWPFCLSKCPYCDFNSHVRERIDEAAWRDALCTELLSIAGKLDQRPILETIFFGGGTPSLMSPETVANIINMTGRLFPLGDTLEVTLEANPTSSEAARFAGFRAAGVNRLSLGVQSLDDKALKFLGRKHTVAEALRAVELARKAFPRLSFDLIYARPDQTPDAWRTELERAISFAADHLSLYQLTIEPNTKFGALAAAGALPMLEDEAAADLYFVTQNVMEAAGLAAYEISNHAGPRAESRHNLIYWRGGAFVGIGPGAHGRLPADGDRRIATETEKAPEKWLRQVRAQGHGLIVESAIDPREQAKELLLMGLRLSEGVSLTRVSALAPALLNDARIAELVEQRFLERNGDQLTTTRRGRPVLNRVIAEIVLP